MSAVAETLEHERSHTIQRRAEWRAGFEEGLKVGAGRAFQSRVIEDIALELDLLRLAYSVVCATAERRERALAYAERQRRAAIHRVLELAHKLDAISPGWDNA